MLQVDSSQQIWKWIDMTKNRRKKTPNQTTKQALIVFIRISRAAVNICEHQLWTAMTVNEKTGALTKSETTLTYVTVHRSVCSLFILMPNL